MGDFERLTPDLVAWIGTRMRLLDCRNARLATRWLGPICRDAESYRIFAPTATATAAAAGAASVLLRRYSAIRRLMPGLRRLQVVFGSSGTADADFVDAVLSVTDLIGCKLAFVVIDNEAALVHLANAKVAELELVVFDVHTDRLKEKLGILRRFRSIRRLRIDNEINCSRSEVELMRQLVHLSDSVAELVLKTCWSVHDVGDVAGFEAFSTVVVEIEYLNHRDVDMPALLKHATRVVMHPTCFNGCVQRMIEPLSASPRLREVHLHDPPIHWLVKHGFAWHLPAGVRHIVLHVPTLCDPGIVPFARVVVHNHPGIVQRTLSIIGKDGTGPTAPEELVCASLLRKLLPSSCSVRLRTDLEFTVDKSTIFDRQKIDRLQFDGNVYDLAFGAPTASVEHLLDHLSETRPDLGVAWSVFLYIIAS